MRRVRNIHSPHIRRACEKLGWPGLREQQKTVMRHLLVGHDMVCVLPTSAGKSAIYQVPAIARDGLVVVISPLVALMQDQVSRLSRHGVSAVTLNSHCSAVDKKRSMDMIRNGTAKLLYISPERMLGMDPAFFGEANVQMYAIDEAHCISEWGHDFRPAYYHLGRTLSRFPKAQKIALTATATPDVVNEIAKVLDIEQTYKRVQFSANRSNITYGVAGRKVSLMRMVKGVGVPAIVYGSTRKSVEQASVTLRRAGYKADFYHAGMDNKLRAEVQEKFTNGELEVIAATCAFGMGIDHPGIRGVVHLEMPTSLESYSQETGRGGRDGEGAKVMCRATVETLEIAKSLVPMTWPSPRRVRVFWRRLLDLFDCMNPSGNGAGKLQLTNREIADQVGMEALEVGSCIRILTSSGDIRRTPYADRPVHVTLLDGADRLKGKKQRRIIAKLREHADLTGDITGSVSFFRTIIELDKTYARELRLRNAIQFQWSDRCQVIEQIHSNKDPGFDEDRVVDVRKRSENRIEQARGFLYTPGCRREYLLNYFGNEGGGDADGDCCDRCMAKKLASA